ncbi:MAG: TPM domain-containing protein [Planctomycetota bacterium]|nr:TPM domain-containing protein [Planctomycetota bacterium]
MLQRLVLICLAFLCLANFSVASTQVDVPKNDGWVTDLAGILTPSTERKLEALMESYRQGSGHEIAVLTVPELEGQSIERLALEVGRSWGLGEKGKNNGALLVVAFKDRKLRIEVGRGLEGHLTDSRCGRIIRNVIAPHFRKGNTDKGIEQGVLAIHNVAGGKYGAIQNHNGNQGGLGSTLMGIVVLVIILITMTRGGGGGMMGWILVNAVMSGGRGGGGGGGGFGGGGFGGFGGGGGFSGGGASGGW